MLREVPGRAAFLSKGLRRVDALAVGGTKDWLEGPFGRCLWAPATCLARASSARRPTACL